MHYYISYDIMLHKASSQILGLGGFNIDWYIETNSLKAISNTRRQDVYSGKIILQISTLSM